MQDGSPIGSDSDWSLLHLLRSVFKLLKLGHFIVDHSPDVLVLDETPAEEMHCQGGEGMEEPEIKCL